MRRLLSNSSRLWFDSRRAALALVAALALGCGNGSKAPGGAFDPDLVPEAYARSTAALAWPGATRAFQITPEGALSNGDWMLRVRPASGGAVAALPRCIAFEDRWLPVAHWRRASGAVRWDFEAVALPEQAIDPASYQGTEIPAPRDSGLFVSLEIRATNLGPAPAQARLDLVLGDLDSTAATIAVDAADPPGPRAWASGHDPALANGWCAIPATGESLGVAWPLAAGATRTLRVVLPSYATPARALADWARDQHADRREQARNYWNGEMQKAARFELGDPEVENALRGALVVLLSCRERRGDHWLPIGNPLQYRDVWLRDGARAIQALAVMGRTEEARALALGLTRYQWEEGAFVSQRGQLDGTGHALWAFEQAFLKSAPSDSLASIAERARRAWGWCERQRAQGRAAGLPFGDMLPYADPRDNEVARAQLVGTDAWAIAGYRATARLLRAAGRAGAADSVEASRARYVADFEAALARSGAADVPPSWQNAGRDWGNLNAAWPCGAIAPDHARSAALAARVWRFAGGAGLAAYASPDSLHTYLGADLGTWALLTGRRAEADSVLGAMLRWRSASGGAAECFSRATRDYGKNMPPHATSAAALIALVRNTLIADDGDTLRLTLGARTAWWRRGRVLHAPTRWGALDLEFSSGREEASWRWTPVPVWTALALPPGTALAGEPTAPLKRGAGTGIVLAPPGARGARVAIVASRSATP